MLHVGYDIVYPSKTAYVGSFSFALTRDIVERACEIKDSDKTEMMWHFIEKIPDVKRCILPFTDYIGEYRARLTLDYPEDYWLLDFVRIVLGHYPTRKEIEALFNRNPDLHKKNWFRQEEMKRGQEVGGSPV